MHASNLRTVTPQVWGAIHPGGRSELVVLDGTLNYQRYIRILCDSMLPWEAVLGETLRMSRIMPRPTQHLQLLLFWPNRMWRSLSTPFDLSTCHVEMKVTLVIPLNAYGITVHAATR